MDSTSPSVPGLVSLYGMDLTIRRAANVAGFGIMVAAGMLWASQPVPSPAPPIDNSFDLEMAKWAILGGIVLAVLALMVLLWRWMKVRTILKEGTVIKGLIEDLDVVVTTSTSNDGHSMNRQTRRSYYAVLRYTVQGEERTVRVKMPNSGFVYGLVKGKETDLVVHDSFPGKPLILSIYRKR